MRMTETSWRRKKVWLSTGLFLSAALVLSARENPAPAEQKVSAPGRYEGYSGPIYSEYVRTSQYVPARDGTRLAIDIYRPGVGGKPVSEPLPVIWTFTPYRRAFRLPDGRLITQMQQMPWAETVLRHGYVIAAADLRGGGASFGVSTGAFGPEEATDAYDIIEWLAVQPWSTGKIGMSGISYQGMTQLMAASTAPPHLTAIMPDMVMFDLYSFAYPGGVFQDDFIAEWSKGVQHMDTVAPAAPVDDDPGGRLLAQATEEHKKNVYPIETTIQGRFRDVIDPRKQTRSYLDESLHSYLKGIREAGSKIGVYLVAGWLDMWPRDMLAWFSNLPNPRKFIILPWSHTHDYAAGWKDTITPLTGFVPKFDYAAEQVRWYDYWLKGIDNGIMAEPPIHYFTMGAAEGDAWKSAQQWPLPQEKPTPYYLQAGPSGSIRSANDGLLDEKQPGGDSSLDDYVVDYTTSTGPATRWHNGRGGNFSYPDMAANDAKGLTYTTPPLEKAVTITGHPIVHLWVTSSADDVDFFAYLEEVDEKGYSHYLTEGVLRASHRKLDPPPFSYMNLPYHRSYAGDVAPLPSGQPVELVFDLHPTSNIFDAGHRLRLTITCADQTSFETPVVSPAPKVSVYRNGKYSSYVRLPMIPAAGEEAAAKGFVLSTTLIVAAIIIAVIFLVLYLRARLKK
jgi:putative CocE/NonD family hydrolase